MAEDIDLRPYLQVLRRRWYWIAGTALVAALAAFAITSTRAPTYEATALVAIVNPQDVVLESLTVENLDLRLGSVDDVNPLISVYPELAISDELLQALLAEINPPLEGVEGVDDLRQLLAAEPGGDVSLLRLSVRYQDAGKAAEVANAWAELFVPWSNDIYNNSGAERLHFFEAQLAQAAADLERAEAALIAFQGENRLTVIENNLAAQEQMQTDYLRRQQQVAFLLQDVQSLRDQMAQSSSNDTNFADQLTMLNLQLRAFNAESVTPIQLQINPGESLMSANQQAQLASLDSLITSLEAQAMDIEQRLAALDPEILELQQAKQEAEVESERLWRNREAAIEAQTALTRRVTEERISAEDVGSGIRLASRAAVPQEAEGSGRIINTVVAGAAGFLLATFFIVAAAWWRSVSEN